MFFSAVVIDGKGAAESLLCLAPGAGANERTDDGRAFRILNILDESSRGCLAIKVKRKLEANDVIDALSDLFILRGVPAFIRCGPEFVTQAVRD